MFEYQNYASLGVNLNRQKYGPLDISNVFTSQADLDYYISKGEKTEGVSEYWLNTIPYPYAGQYVALVDGDNVTPYIISEKNGSFNTTKLSNSDTGLEELKAIVANKVDIQYFQISDETGELKSVSGTLLSPADQEKLDQLIITDEGLQISSKISAANVENLDSWIANNRNTIPGLLSQDAENKIKDLTPIKSINLQEFQIDNGGQLNLNTIPINKVEGLSQISDKIIELDTKVGNFETILSNYVLQNTFDEKIEEIENKLLWQNI